MPLDSHDLAYLAGFLDGEGCITLVRMKPKRYILRVNFTHTNKEILVWMKALFGGYLGPRKRRSDKHKTAWGLNVDGPRGENFIRAIYPWIKIKKGQAEVALKFRESVRRTVHFPDKLGLSRGIAKERDILKQKISVLNRKGG